MRYILSLILLLAALWLGLSGVYKPLILLLGAGSIALVVWLSVRMDVIGVEHSPVIFSWRLPVYWAWLLWQIVIANLQVAGQVMRPARIRPQVVELPVQQVTAVARVTYANSVTLTPGTVTLLLQGDRLVAHALSDTAAEGALSGDMGRRVSWLEGEP